MHGGEAAPPRDTNVQTSTLGGSTIEGNFIRASDGMQEYQLLEQPPDHVQPMEGGGGGKEQSKHDRQRAYKSGYTDNIYTRRE